MKRSRYLERLAHLMDMGCFVLKKLLDQKENVRVDCILVGQLLWCCHLPLQGVTLEEEEESRGQEKRIQSANIQSEKEDLISARSACMKSARDGSIPIDGQGQMGAGGRERKDGSCRRYRAQGIGQRIGIVVLARELMRV